MPLARSRRWPVLRARYSILIAAALTAAAAATVGVLLANGGRDEAHAPLHLHAGELVIATPDLRSVRAEIPLSGTIINEQPGGLVVADGFLWSVTEQGTVAQDRSRAPPDRRLDAACLADRTGRRRRGARRHVGHGQCVRNVVPPPFGRDGRTPDQASVAEGQLGVADRRRRGPRRVDLGRARSGSCRSTVSRWRAPASLPYPGREPARRPRASNLGALRRHGRRHEAGSEHRPSAGPDSPAPVRLLLGRRRRLDLGDL